MSLAPTVQRFLDQHQTPYQLIPHAKSFSSKERADTAGVRQDHIAKAVILNDDKGFLMAVIPGDSWVKLHALRQALGRTLAITPERESDSLFPDCQAGAYPALGPAYGLETVLDQALTSLAYVYLEAGDHKHLLKIDGDAYRRLLSGVRLGHFSQAR